MSPRDIRVVAGWILFEQHDVRDQAGACITAFDQIVRQNPVVRETAREGLLECVDIVDPLADERALAKDVLVDIRDGTRVGVDAGLATAQQFVIRRVGCRQAGGHAWLQDAVAARDALQGRIEHRAVQWMRHGGDELARGFARQLGIGIQGDDVFDRCQRRDLAHHQRECAVGAAAHQAVQVGQLAALALVPHPGVFLRVPAARTMQQQERRLARIGQIQALDGGPGMVCERCIGFGMLGGGIGKIGQQAKAQLRIAIGQEAHFQRFGQFIDTGEAGQQCRHHHQCRQRGRNPLGKIHPRQRFRHCRQRDNPVHQRQAEMAGCDQGRQRQQRQDPGLESLLPTDAEQGAGGRQGQRQDRAHIQPQRRLARAALERFQARELRPRRLLQQRAAIVDQVITDMRAAVIATARLGCLIGKCDGLAGDFGFGQRRTFADLFDHVAVMVTRRKIHGRVDTAGIGAQDRLDHAHLLDELAPLHGPQKTQAADAVGDRYLVGCLLLALLLHHLLDGAAGFGQALRDPRQRQGQRRTLAAQAARQFCHEGGLQRRLGARHVGHRQDQAAGILFGDCGHLVGPGVSQITAGAAGGQTSGDTTQVFDQRQTQHDRNRPQLAQAQWRDLLVGSDEAAQVFRIDPAVAVRDGFQRDVVDARLTCRRSFSQARQLLAVTLRQMPLSRADLFFDQVEIIQQPFGRRRQLPVFLDCTGEDRAGVQQHRFIVRQAAQQLVAHTPLAHAVGLRQASAVMFHLYRAEQFGAQRQFVVIAAAATALDQGVFEVQEGSKEGRSDDFQFGRLFLSARPPAARPAIATSGPRTAPMRNRVQGRSGGVERAGGQPESSIDR